MSYKYNNIVIKPGLYLGDNLMDTNPGATFPVFSSMQLSLDGTNDVSRRDNNISVLPGYKAILYKNTGINYITVYTIDNTNGGDIKSINSATSGTIIGYNPTAPDEISKIDLFYNNVKIDYSNIKTMGFKASARLCWGAKLGEHSDGSYNKYALVLESSTPKRGAADENETSGLIGLNRPYLSLPWIQPIVTTNSSISFWWCSKGLESGVGNADISYALSLYTTTAAKSSIFHLNDNVNDYLHILFPRENTGQLTFYLNNQGTTYQYASGKNICDGLWHHIVWNISGGSWTIYTDGVAETSVNKASYNMGAITDYSSTIGTRNVIHQDNQTNGYIADFRFYKNVLSPTEINGLLNGDHTYRTTLDVSSCLFQYTFDPDAVYTNNYTTYAIGAATVPYAAELRNGAEIMMPSMDLTGSLGKNIKILPFTIGSNGFSISFWWRSDGLWATQGENSRLFYLGNGDETSNITFSLKIGTNGYPTIGVTSTTQNLTTLTDFSDDTWKHVVWTMTSESTWKLYVNNALINTYTGMAYPDVIQRSTNYIGSGYLTTDGYPCGFIGDFRMYNATLSSDNVKSLYNRTNTTNNEINLIQHYDFVEETMNANNNILYSNAPKYALELTNATGTTGSAGQYGSMTLGATGTNGLTISFWWKAKGGYAAQGTNYGSVFDFGSSTTNGSDGIEFYVRWGGNAYPGIQVRIDNTNSAQIDLTTLTDFCDGDWKHVVWTMTYVASPTSNTSTWNLYVNNKRYGLGNLTTVGYYPINAARGNAYFGRTWSSTYNYGNGYIADFRVYDELFTWQKITDLYNNVYTSETNLLLHTLYPNKTAPTLNNGAKISTSKTELTNTTQTRESSYFKLDVSGGSYADFNGNPTGFITNAGVSFAFWFKPTATQGAINPMIFDFGNFQASDNIFFGKSSASNAPYLAIYLGSTNRTNFTLSNNSTFFSEQVWKHVVWTMTYSDGATSTWNVYINGIQYGGAPLTTTGYYPNSLSRYTGYIGKSSWSNDGITYGQIADFRVYTSVLNLRNVNDLYIGRYTDTTTLFINYPVNANGDTFPAPTNRYNEYSGATISPETITVSYQTPPPTSLYLQTDPSLNYHRGSYLSLPPLVKPGTNGLSFSIWWRAAETYANQGPGACLFSFSNGKHRDAIEFCLRSGTNSYPNIGVHNGIKNGYIDVDSITSLCDGTWKHIVWTMTYCAPTQNTSTWIIYVNGTALSTVTTTGFYPTNVLRKYAYIGQSSFIQDRYPTGDFADFRVYGAVLTQANVNSLYALSDTTDNEGNLLLRQKFDSTESYLYQTCDNIKPSVLLENDPAITNTPTGQHVVLPALPGLLSTDVPDRRGISISFWWKAKGLSGISGMLFESGFAQDNDVFFLRTRDGLNSYMSSQFYYGTGNDVNIQFGTADGDIENLENGEWHHIVWTMSFEGYSLNSYWKYYMDGYFIKTTGLIGNAYLDGTNNTFNARQVNNFIGRSNWATINGCLNGYMSDFRIYNNCLTIQDVGDLYTNTYDDNSDLFLRYSFEKKIKIENVFNTSISNYVVYNQQINSTNKTISLTFSANASMETSITDHPKGIKTAMNTGASGGHGQLSSLTNSNDGMTFSFWFKPTGAQGSAARIFDFGNGQNADNILIWKPLSTSDYPQVWMTRGSPPTPTTAINLSNLTDFFTSGTGWKHIVWTLSYSASNTSTWNVYYNGALYGGAALITNSYYPAIGTRSSNFIGKSNWAGDGALQGMLTDFRIYNRTLTAAEALALYNNTSVSTADLYFSTNFALNVPQFYTPSHSTDTTQVARLYNGATLSTDTYKFGTSSLFLSNATTTTNVVYTSGPGYGQCMQTIAPLPKLGTNGISFSFWWKSAGIQGSSSTIFDFAEDANNRITFYDVSNSSTSPRLQLITGASVIYSYAISQTNFNDSNWHHVVWNINKYNNSWEVFYDNVSSDTITSKMYPENVSRSFCFFGRSTVAAELYANGYIDEFRIYSKVLTATDVDNLYKNIDTTSTSLTDNLIVYYSFNQDASKKVMDEQYIDNNVLDTPIFNT